jgi:integrase
MKRTQVGYTFRKGNSWFVRFWDQFVKDGVMVRKQVCRRVGGVEDQHKKLRRPPEAVLGEVERLLAPLNHAIDPAKNLTLADFVQRVWLPSVESRCAASTVATYRFYWQRFLKPRCGSALLRDFNTPAAQQLLETIARQHPDLKKATLSRIKSQLSGMFKLACQQEFRTGQNPLTQTTLPRAPEASETHAYSLADVLQMLALLPEPARTVVGIAAFTGLRRGEISGLLWESYDPEGQTLMVLRSVWNGIAGAPKTRKSRAAVPVIPALARMLDAHRLRSGNPQTGPMFPTSTGRPISLNNLLADQITPVLSRCGSCWKAEGKHTAAVDHKYERDSSLPEWHGWHAFRRFAATSLHELGVSDMEIQKILRHSNVSITQSCYIKSTREQSISALGKLSELIAKSDANFDQCNESATRGVETKVLPVQ